MPEIELGPDYDMVLGMSNSYFRNTVCTLEAVDEFIEKMTSAGFDFNAERMRADVTKRHTVQVIGKHSVLEDSGDHEDWLNTTTGDGFKREIDWHYWGHYRDYVVQERGFPKSVVAELDDVTTGILSKLEDPARPGAWDRRGLVMGSVQSGKTANYTALIAKAIDAGYKMIIVLTGVHDSLRSQTQLRINDELLGYDSEKAMRMEDIAYRKIGVGRYPGHRERGGKPMFIQSLTTSNEKGDFKKTTAEVAGFTRAEPYVLVIKKHVSILKNLAAWIGSVAGEADEEGRLRVTDIPLLLIDDECDQASVNTRRVVKDPDTGQVSTDCDPAKTNQRIRELLTIFDKSAYIGYTATPYANVFIHHDTKHPIYGDDLFPRNFIFNLPQPDSYVGAQKTFGLVMDDPDETEALPLLGGAVTDGNGVFPPKHKKDLVVRKLPDSLVRAIKTFVLACAAKRIRQTRNPHDSMLVHVTRFTDVQGQVRDRVTAVVRELKGRIIGAGTLADLQGIWEEDFQPISESMGAPMHDWEEVKQNLVVVIRKVKVQAINGASSDALQYKDAEDSATKAAQRGEEVPWEDRGAHVIAIGGDKLSRGLTLEGLTITYYLRPSSMYDTLMQMGRWFGYRAGYLDLCRINTTQEICRSFQQISRAEIHLRQQFDHMALMGLEPKDFGLSVLVDPGMLKITNAGKRRDTQVIDQSFSGRLSATINFDQTAGPRNLTVLGNLLNDCDTAAADADLGTSLRHPTGRNYHWRGVPRQVVYDFLFTYKGSSGATVVNPKVLAGFIDDQRAEDLSQWDVVVINKEKAAKQIQILGRTIGCTTRVANGPISPENLAIGTLLSPADEWLDFSETERKACVARYREVLNVLGEEDPGDGKPPGTFIRESRPKDRALLLIYGICSNKGDPSRHYGMVGGEELYGFVLSFPAWKGARNVRARVNQVYIDANWTD